MPALVLYRGLKHKLSWLGTPKGGEFKGQRRARIQKIGTHHVEWVDASEIQFIDNKPKTAERVGKEHAAGKD